MSSATEQFLQRKGLDFCTGGRYSLASRYDLLGNRREFACRTTRISPYQMLVAAPVPGPPGERVVSHFGEFGKLEGLITDIVDGGFLVDLAATKIQRVKLADKLVWLEKRQKDPAVIDVRQQQRHVPANPHTTLLFGDGTALTCFVIDVSTSGVAVSADVEVEIGERLAVGRSVGHVVRRFAEGFAVQFDHLQDANLLEEIIRPTSELIAVAAGPQDETSVWLV